MAKAIRMHQHGGPEVLRWEEVDPGTPGPGEALVRHEAVGLNYIDIYHRSGLYPLPALPATPGMEAAGVVEAIGPGVSRWPWATAWPMPASRPGPTPRSAAFRPTAWCSSPRAYQRCRPPP